MQVDIGTRKGLFTLTRGPRGWSVALSAFVAEPVSMLLAVGDTVYVALRLGHFGGKLHRSDDGGRTFTEVGVPTYPPAPEPAEPAETDGFGRPWPWKLDQIWSLERDARGRLWAGTIPGGLFRSEDRGQTWELDRGLWDRPERRKWFGGGYDTPGIHSVALDPRDPDVATLGVSCGGVWLTRDAGASWTLGRGMHADYMPPEQREAPEIQDPHRIVRCASAPDVLWSQHHSTVFRSGDGGLTWDHVPTAERGAPADFGFAVAVDPNDADTAWLVPAEKDERRVPVRGDFCVTRTRDGGRSWQVLKQGLPSEPAYDLVYRHGLDVDASGRVLVMGSTTGALWVSEDAGDAWTLVSAHLPPIYCVRFRS